MELWQIAELMVEQAPNIGDGPQSPASLDRMNQMIAQARLEAHQRGEPEPDFDPVPDPASDNAAQMMQTVFAMPMG